MKLSFAAVAVLSSAMLLSAAGKAPNFSGDWKLDTSKSDFGEMPAPDTMSMKVSHADPSLAVTQTQTGGPMGGFTAEYKYSTDGSPTSYTVRGNQLTSTAKWEGEVLRVTTKLNFQGNDVTMVDTWKMLAGGKTMELSRAVTTSQGNGAMKFIWVRDDKK